MIAGVFDFTRGRTRHHFRGAGRECSVERAMYCGVTRNIAERCNPGVRRA